jgi:hypothetical protein
MQSTSFRARPLERGRILGGQTTSPVDGRVGSHVVAWWIRSAGPVKAGAVPGSRSLDIFLDVNSRHPGPCPPAAD